jgi:hypothetical protein
VIQDGRWLPNDLKALAYEALPGAMDDLRAIDRLLSDLVRRLDYRMQVDATHFATHLIVAKGDVRAMSVLAPGSSSSAAIPQVA